MTATSIRTIVLDGNRMQTEELLYEHIFEKFKFPTYYTRDLNSVWDGLTEWIELPLNIHWKNFAVCKDNLGAVAYRTLSLFEEAQSKVRGIRLIVD